MAPDQDRGGPAAAGLGVLLMVVVLVAAVLLAQRIPHAKRPSLIEPQYSAVTTSPTPPAGP